MLCSKLLGGKKVVINVKYTKNRQGEILYEAKDPNIKGLICHGSSPSELYENLERMRKYAKENGFT